MKESNEILVQQECLKAIREAGMKLDKMLGDFKEEGVIPSYELVVKPYNNGYEISIDIDIHFSRFSELPRDTHFLFNLSSVFIHPESFFDSDMNDGTGRMCFKTVKRTPDAKEYFYGRNIGSVDDIKAFCKNFVESI